MNWPRFAAEITDWISELYDPSGGFRFWREGKVTLKGTAFAVFTLALLGELERHPSRKEIIEYLLSSQDPENGDFIERYPLTAHPPFTLSYIQNQIDMFVLDALRLLDAKPAHKLRRIERELADLDPEAYLQELDWSNCWYVSNPVMFRLSFTDHLADWIGPDEAMEELHRRFLAALLKRQDPATGFWGPDQGAGLHNSLYGSFHFLSYFHFRGVQLPHLQEMSANTLRLQSSEGFFVLSPGGGACEDFDGIDVLLKSTRRDGMTEPVRKAMHESFQAVMNSRNEDGGFPWALRRHQRSIHNILFPLRNLRAEQGLVPRLKLIFRNWLQLCCGSPRWHYSGLEFISVPYRESDLWSTYFRLLGLAAIDQQLPHFEDTGWRFRDFPGMGWQEAV